MTKIKPILLVLLLAVSFGLRAQDVVMPETNVISTAVPALIIAPDARSGALGDCGVSTSPDVYSMHWNAAKYAFQEDDFSIGLAYTPWLRKLVPDMNIAYLAVSKRVSKMSTVAASLLYFNLGDINFRGDNNEDLGTYRPNEFAVDVCYSRKLGDYISGAVSGRFIYSNLTQGKTNNAKPAFSVAADIGVYYQRPLYMKTMRGEIAWGVAITNIGSKMAYSDATTKKDFIPTNLRLGPTFTMFIDDYNSLMFTLDINKLLVPTPPLTRSDSTGTYIVAGKDNNVSMIQGIFQSFYDAPGGYKEELKEFTIGLGAEYWYNKVFTVRAGFFHEDKMKGNRRYLTFGAGIRYNVFALDISYLVPVNNTSNSGINPLENQLRFNLVFNINKWKKDNTKLENKKEKDS